MSELKGKSKEWWEKTNTRAIYLFSIGLFVLVIVSSIKSLGIVMDYAQLIMIGAITILLLFRYFSDIKLGNILELKRVVQRQKIEQNELKESAATAIEEVSRKSSVGVPLLERRVEGVTMPFEQKVEICLRMLRDINYRWRTRGALMKKSKMSDNEFEEFLSNHPEVILSPVPDSFGNQLYGLEERVKELQE